MDEGSDPKVVVHNGAEKGVMLWEKGLEFGKDIQADESIIIGNFFRGIVIDFLEAENFDFLVVFNKSKERISYMSSPNI